MERQKRKDQNPVPAGTLIRGATPQPSYTYILLQQTLLDKKNVGKSQRPYDV